MSMPATRPARQQVDNRGKPVASLLDFINAGLTFSAFVLFKDMVLESMILLLEEMGLNKSEALANLLSLIAVGIALVVLTISRPLVMDSQRIVYRSIMGS